MLIKWIITQVNTLFFFKFFLSVVGDQMEAKDCRNRIIEIGSTVRYIGTCSMGRLMKYMSESVKHGLN